MCDDKCPFYKDCCADANKGEVNVPVEFTCVETPFDGGISMVKSCPYSWNDTKITELCVAKNQVTLSYDFLVAIPVTSTQNGITYGNVFCAICNEETKYTFWNVALTYERVAALNVTAYQYNTSTNANSSDISQNAARPGNSNSDSDGDSDDGFVSLDGTEATENARDIIANLAYNETGEMLWSSNVNGSFYRCRLREKLPSDLTQVVRYCVANAVQTCPDGGSCGTNTSYIYTDDEKIYKNAYCAACNRYTGEYKGCRAERYNNNKKKEEEEAEEAAAVVEIPMNDAAIPKVDHCNEIPTDSAAHQLLCGGARRSEEDADADANALGECFDSSKSAKKKILCYINKDYSLSKGEFYFINNETIFLLAYDMEMPFSEWAQIDNDTVYVCGLTIPRTRYQRVMHYINDLVTEVLIKVSIVCMLLHLLAFVQLSELQNLSGKNLASFCVALLVAFILFDVGQWLPSCEHTAIVQHFCFLCCFTWMLVMSYDVWLSLYRATSQFRTSAGKHKTKFLIYSTVAWISPLFIVAPAAYIEFAPSNVVGCDLKPAYGKFGQCFIGQKKPIFYFFFIPASVIFFVNICFFAHTAYMIYLSQRKTVNPNTRHDFRLYSRLGLLMGLTWTLGSLVTITNSELISLLFTIFNMSQGIFIFFGFTFKRKTAKGLLQRHRDNKFLSSTFSTFVSSAEMGTTVSESTAAGTRPTQMDVL